MRAGGASMMKLSSGNVALMSVNHGIECGCDVSLKCMAWR